MEISQNVLGARKGRAGAVNLPVSWDGEGSAGVVNLPVSAEGEASVLLPAEERRGVRSDAGMAAWVGGGWERV